jgi:UDP-GlcNAc:undecaprenyl-phosphate GlcNAc-1-phosphate transferase
VNLLLAFIASMAITMALIPLLYRCSGRLQVLDAPAARKVHTRPVPRIGGIAMALGVFVTLLYLARHEPGLPAYLTGASLLLAMGVWDDRVTLAATPKFLAQLVAAAIVVIWGGVLVHSVTLAERIELPAWIAYPLSVLFIVGVTNAINLSDGLDGLAGGTTLLCCAATGLLALGSGQSFVAAVAVITAGSLLGFLRYNTYPARIFMGDGGSQWLGFTIATLAIQLTQDATAPFSASLPLLLLGLPVLDTLTVIAQRISEGRSPFAADRSHIHHKLLALGFDHHEAVIVIYLVQVALFLAAWQLRFEPDPVVIATFAAFAGAILGLLFAAGRTGWRWRGALAPSQGRASGVAAHIAWLRAPHRLPAWLMAATALGATVYASHVVMACSAVPRDVGGLALGTLLVLLFAIAGASPSGRAREWTAQAALYVTVVIVVYLDLRYPPAGQWSLALTAAVFGAMGACVMLAVRLTHSRRFRLTSLDLLVIFVVLALPNLPGSYASPRSLGLSALVLLVLFYAVEMLFGRSRVVRHGLVSVCAALLLAVVVRGFA